MNIKKTGYMLAGVLLVTSLGCGCGKSSTNIDAGMAAIQELDYSKAQKFFEQAIVEKEDLQQAYRGEGLAYLGNTEYEKAEEAFKSALGHGGLFATDMERDINYYLALTQYKAGKSEEAIKTLDAIAGINEKDAEVYYMRGCIEMESGDQQQAVLDLNQALYNAKNDIGMTIEIYKVFAQNGHEAEGRAYLSSAVENRLDKMSDYEKGVVYYYMEDYDEARNFLEASSTTSQMDYENLLMLGKTYEKLGDSNYAASLYEKYIKDNGGNAVIYNQLGLCKLQNGKYQEALQAFENGIKTENNASVIQQLKYNQIAAYEYLSDYKKAGALMDDYLKQYPDDVSAKRESQFLETR